MKSKIYCLLTGYDNNLEWLKTGVRRADTTEKLKARRSEFENEIANMTLQLIMYLNAGLVVTGAFDELISRNSGSLNPLYTELGKLKASCSAANLSFPSELFLFAQRTGNRDFIRLCMLILEHSGHGSELCDKLERERSQLWRSRLNNARARAKEAETKLCFPLMILLMVLVIISIAPAFMQM